MRIVLLTGLVMLSLLSCSIDFSGFSFNNLTYLDHFQVTFPDAELTVSFYTNGNMVRNCELVIRGERFAADGILAGQMLYPEGTQLPTSSPSIATLTISAKRKSVWGTPFMPYYVRFYGCQFARDSISPYSAVFYANKYEYNYTIKDQSFTGEILTLTGL